MSLFLVWALLQGESVDPLIEKLRSDNVAERNRAVQELKKMGEGARPALEKAEKDKDGEVVNTAKEILETLDLEVFRQIEAKVEKSRTARVRFKYEGKGPGEDLGGGKGSGTLLLKEGNLVRFEMEFSLADGGHRVTVISDGTRLSAVMDKEPPIFSEAPKDLKLLFAKALARGGVFVLASRRETQDPRQFMEARSCRVGDAGADGRTLTYTLLLPAVGETADIKLWYDPKTLLPRKRAVVIRREGRIFASVTETYEDFTLDDELPAEKFKLAEEKK